MTQRDSVLRALRGRKRPLTADQIADKAGLDVSAVRVVLTGLQKSGEVSRQGTLPQAIGRPANLYLLSN